ncbi:MULTISPECIES: CheR family methyltransferase [unclassified Microcoleus]|uniref:CheR family methyltransferase n=1 Tax=unclassified Microcoleus TaxID=2642155 RepID=UPI001D28B57F|nr:MULTISPECIES: CheR family methyltransferase [unclassified Microcoleus]MCC3505133.1 tetratricopeptide repeat protein [Microcoleus sp. PH2017_19_SFW_U_A]MCC3524470.1 tetratricopeptide repeat protein [Microcoleus sp. PH2017_20_SFW_D_A]MCC3555214.1 tetratricopeptide repeat protein [Microcoleus sp. PH2017_35_SFW_U_B]
MVNCQLSTVNCQLSTVNCQLSTVNCQLSTVNCQLIEALLRQKIGLDALTIGSNTITRAVNRRMEDCGLTDISIYLTKLQTSPPELEELIEAVVIPETWFFRDREPFVFLSRYALSEWFPQNPGKTLRVLSLPCSTGEEPYSIAIALLDAGLNPINFSIDAADISKVALKKAQRAVYGRNSFRDKNLDFRDRYFTPLPGDLYQLNDLVRRKVNLIQGNILDSYFLSNQLPYDAIFCRNVLIYFDQTGRNQTIQLLNRLLNKTGILFLGHSESGQKLPPQFVSVRHSLAFAYRKTDIPDSPQVQVKKEPTNISYSRIVREFKHAGNRENIRSDQLPSINSKSSTSHQKYPRENENSGILPIRAIAPPPDPAKSASADLDAARRLADRGQLQEAAKLCETYLSQNPTNADAYVLLGQVYQARGDRQQAEQSFQKATYLKPDHYEGLIHLALLKEERGDIAGAAIVRRRIQRMEK